MEAVLKIYAGNKQETTTASRHEGHSKSEFANASCINHILATENDAQVTF